MVLLSALKRKRGEGVRGTASDPVCTCRRPSADRFEEGACHGLCEEHPANSELHNVRVLPRQSEDDNRQAGEKIHTRFGLRNLSLAIMAVNNGYCDPPSETYLPHSSNTSHFPGLVAGQSRQGYVISAMCESGLWEFSGSH